MSFCPNLADKKIAEQFNKLIELNNENIAYYLWDKYQGEVPNEFYKNSIITASVGGTVQYTHKIINSLSKALENRKTIRVSTADEITNIRKYLNGQGVPTEQVDLMLEFLKTQGKTEVKTSELITDMLAAYSYAVEINIATETAKSANRVYGYTPNVDVNSLYIEQNSVFRDFVIKDKNGNLLNPVAYKTREEAEEVLKNIGNKPSQYYSNLTVPGGINYTEQEIATPAITPSIKGHAQFATDKGIGWFRSDEPSPYSNTMGLDVNAMTDEEYNNYLKNYPKIRRILEVQSDLFQKGRDKENLLNKREEYSSSDAFKNDEIGRTRITREQFDAIDGKILLNSTKEFSSSLEVDNANLYKKENPKESTTAIYKYQNGKRVAMYNLSSNTFVSIQYGKRDSTENQFLQLLNKDNNWVTFFVKSIIQDSVKQGYEKVLFPSGNTASKVEGHTTLEEFKKQKQDRIKFLQEEQKRLEKLPDGIENFEDISYDDMGRPEGFVTVSKEEELKKNSREIDQLKQELARIDKEGFGALRPIYNFYENTVRNILKKQGFEPREFKDEYGNTWNEITLTNPRVNKLANSSIAFRTQKSTATETINKEKALNWLEQRFPGMSVEFYDMAKNIGNGQIHGYVENAAVKLWSSAEVGTEYHEAYHITFRTMLSDSQRIELYNEAEKEYGKPTDAEIAEIKKQFPDISDREANRLVLEEKMAEGFREYVLTEQESGKTLSGKLKSWFKNLWNWIKAMFSDNLSIKQVYSLIESNSLNRNIYKRNVFRNPQQFQGNNTANMYREGFGDVKFQETLSVLETVFIETKNSNRFNKKEFGLNASLGIGENRGLIVNKLVTDHLYVTTDGSKLTTAAALELLKAEIAYEKNPTEENEQTMVDLMDKYNVDIKDTDASGRPDPTYNFRSAIINVWDTWFTQKDPATGNLIIEGWREFLLSKLADRGLVPTTRSKDKQQELREAVIRDIEDEDNQDLETSYEEIDAHIEKIYGKSSLEKSPSKSFTAKLRNFLASIYSPIPNSFGVTTYMDKNYIYAELISIVAGSQSYEQLLAKMKNHSQFKPHLKRVYEFLSSSKRTNSEKAMFFSGFSLAFTGFVLHKTREAGNARFVDVINANRKTGLENQLDKWNLSVVDKGVNSDRALYNESIKMTVDADGNNVEATTRSIKEDKLKSAVNSFMSVQEDLYGRNPARLITVGEDIHPTTKQLAQTIWDLGMHLGSSATLLETQKALQTIINSEEGIFIQNDKGIMVNKKGSDLAKELFQNLRLILNNLGKYEKPGKGQFLGKLLEAKANPVKTYIQAETSSVRIFAEINSLFTPPAPESVVTSDGKSKYPVNLQSHLVEIVNTIKNGGSLAADLIKVYLQDPSIKGGEKEEFGSILIQHLKGNAEFLGDFSVEDFDAIKGDRVDDAITYEDFSEFDNYVVRINNYINGGKEKTFYVAVPAQADRSKYSLVAVPKLLSNKYNVLDRTKSTVELKQELVKRLIIQDLLRVAEAKRQVKNYLTGKIPFSDLIQGYHYDEKTNRIVDENDKLLGRAFKEEFFQLTAVNEKGEQIVKNISFGLNNEKIDGHDRLSDVIGKYVKATKEERLSNPGLREIDNLLAGMTDQVISYFDRKASELQKTLNDNDRMSDIGFGHVKGNKDEFFKNFIFEEAIARLELIKLFRGNRALFKSTEEFYKRMGHLTTPGIKLLVKGDLATSPEYGMFAEYNETTLYDLKGNLQSTGQAKRQNAVADNIYQGLVNAKDSKGNFLYSEEEARSISDAYRPGEYDATDAQAWISIDMYRAIQQGLGLWDDINDEAAYKAYKAAPVGQKKFVYQEGFVPEGFKVGDAVQIKPIKPYYEKISNSANVTHAIMEKNSYNILLEEYTINWPRMNDLRQRMESEEVYAGLEPVHVVNVVSGKKSGRKAPHTVQGINGEYTGVFVSKNNSRGLRFPQTIPDAKENPTVALNRQIKKNMLANVQDDTIYTIDAGLESATKISGAELKELMHSAISEKVYRGIDRVTKQYGLDKLMKAKESGNIKEFNKIKLEVLKAVRSLLEQNIKESDLPSNYLRALDIVFDETGSPRFTIPLDLPFYNKKFESILMSTLNNQVFKQKVSGYEAVQVAQIGGFATDENRELEEELKFYQIDGDRLVHAEIMVRPDVLRNFNLPEGEYTLDSIPEELRRVIGYRIPNQDKASTVILKIKGFLPANYAKAILVPGQLTKLMGSDFDVDKMNLMFPSIKQIKNADGTTSFKKDSPDYNNLRSLDKVSDNQLTNIVLDLMEAVMSNPVHFAETLSPLDDKTLPNLVKEINKKNPELAQTFDFNDYRTEADAIGRNLIGNTMRGIWANQVAGANVAWHGVVNVNDKYAIKVINASGEIKTFTKFIKQTKDETGKVRTLDKAGSMWLSAAVDAGKDPIQYELNDNVITAPVRQLFMATFPDDYANKMGTMFLNQPIIRDFINIFQTKYNNDLTQIKNAYSAAVKLYGGTPAMSPQDIDITPMNLVELQNIMKEGRDKTVQIQFMNNFYKFYKAGQSIQRFYKRITPDAMDGMNRLGSINSYFDKAEAFNTESQLNNDEDVILYGPDSSTNVVDQFIGNNSVYKYQKAYNDLLKFGLEFGSVMFPARGSAAFEKAKFNIKKLSGQKELTPEMHQLIDYNLMFLMLRKPGSPLRKYLEGQRLNDKYFKKDTNIVTKLESVAKDFPSILHNPFIANLQKDVTGDTAETFYGIKFDNSFSMTRAQKEQMTNGLRNLIYNPLMYIKTDGPVELDKDGVPVDSTIKTSFLRIKSLGIDLIVNNFAVNAFRQSSQSYHDLIPIEYLTQIQKVEGHEPTSIVQFFEKEKAKLEDPNYFNMQDLHVYMQSFGKMVAGGKPLLKRYSKKINFDALDRTGQTELKVENAYQEYIVVRDENKLSRLYKKLNKNTYIAVKELFARKKVYGIEIGEGDERYRVELNAMMGDSENLLNFEPATNNAGSPTGGFLSCKISI
jgi:hypothetical protein